MINDRNEQFAKNFMITLRRMTDKGLTDYKAKLLEKRHAQATILTSTKNLQYAILFFASMFISIFINFMLVNDLGQYFSDKKFLCGFINAFFLLIAAVSIYAIGMVLLYFLLVFPISRQKQNIEDINCKIELVNNELDYRKLNK